MNHHKNVCGSTSLFVLLGSERERAQSAEAHSLLFGSLCPIGSSQHFLTRKNTRGTVILFINQTNQLYKSKFKKNFQQPWHPHTLTLPTIMGLLLMTTPPRPRIPSHPRTKPRTVDNNRMTILLRPTGSKHPRRFKQ